MKLSELKAAAIENEAKAWNAVADAREVWVAKRGVLMAVELAEELIAHERKMKAAAARVKPAPIKMTNNAPVTPLTQTSGR